MKIALKLGMTCWNVPILLPLQQELSTAAEVKRATTGTRYVCGDASEEAPLYEFWMCHTADHLGWLTLYTEDITQGHSHKFHKYTWTV